MKGRIIGICGGIGSGKSVVSRVLRLRGEMVYDCDFEARRIMDSSPEVMMALYERYGEEVCPAAGPICRPELSKRVFGNREERLWLNAMVHRMVREDVREWADAVFSAGGDRCFVESAILASSGLADMCSDIILVDAPEPLRVARVGDRDGIAPEDIRRRIESQREETRLAMDSGCRIVSVCNDNNTSILESLGNH
ncbi:MAG: dephospho-CoA kinase [Muribaculaceae bacterium]|nr:dephospho-CoA kinase [Muribaculaceae bacterium]